MAGWNVPRHAVPECTLIPDSDEELVAGYTPEYSGMKFGSFYNISLFKSTTSSIISYSSLLKAL